MGKKTLDEIRDDSWNLARYRLEFIFRNEALRDLVEDYYQIHRSLVTRQGWAKRSTWEETRAVQEEYVVKGNALSKFLEGFHIYIPADVIGFDQGVSITGDGFQGLVQHFPDLTTGRGLPTSAINSAFLVDFFLHLLKRGTIGGFPSVIGYWDPRVDLKKIQYRSMRYLTGVHAIIQSKKLIRGYRYITKITELEWENRFRGEWKAVVRGRAELIREMLPAIMANYGRLHWGASQAESTTVHEVVKMMEALGQAYSPETAKFYYVLGPRDVHECTYLDDGKFLTIKLDVTRTKKQLLKELESMIDFVKETILGDELRDSRRAQLKLYDEYLKVWDLFKKTGKKWTEIAKQVFPDDFIDTDAQQEAEYYPDPEGARIRVQQYYEKARKLIDEGLP